MQKIIVTTSNFTGYSTIFAVDGDCIELQSEDEISENTYHDLCLIKLPMEIKFDIFERVLIDMLKAGLVKKALKCLITSSSQLCRIFYTKYIGYYNLTMLQILDHLISMFRIIDSITNEIFSESNLFEYEELSLSIRCLNPMSIDVDLLSRWPLIDVEKNFFTIPSAVIGDEVKKIVTGPCHSDLVWIEGIEDRGIINATSIKGPILILEVFSNIGDVEFRLFRRNTHFFRNFVRMLKLVLGTRSAVFLSVPVDGFFNSLTEIK